MRGNWKLEGQCHRDLLPSGMELRDLESLPCWVSVLLWSDFPLLCPDPPFWNRNAYCEPLYLGNMELNFFWCVYVFVCALVIDSYYCYNETL